MLLAEQRYTLDDREIILRSARLTDLGKSLGFKECGRIPNANRYDDGTYADDILMVLQW